MYSSVNITGKRFVAVSLCNIISQCGIDWQAQNTRFRSLYNWCLFSITNVLVIFYHTHSRSLSFTHTPSQYNLAVPIWKLHQWNYQRPEIANASKHYSQQVNDIPHAYVLQAIIFFWYRGCNVFIRVGYFVQKRSQSQMKENNFLGAKSFIEPLHQYIVILHATIMMQKV